MRSRLAVALMCGAAAIACRSREGPPGNAQPSAKATSDVRPKASAVPTPEQRQVSLVGCRVLGVNGPNAKTSGAAFQGRFFAGSSWLELGADLSLSLKHSETTREFAVHGPGRFLVCAGGEESVLVASGGFSSTAGPGSRAGAEVLVGTPLGAVRYGDANLRIDVQPERFELNVTHGLAMFDRAGESGTGATKTVEGPKGRFSLTASADAKRLVMRCEDLRARVARGRKPGVPAAASAGPALGTWAVAQLKARQEARVACASARAASGRLEEPEQSRLLSLTGTPDTAALADAETAPDAGK